MVNSKKKDGTLSGLQFDDVNNSMSGPIELIEVDEEELQSTVVIQERPTFGQMLIEEVVVPGISEAVQKGLNIGFNYFERWLEENAIPKTKKKVKEFSENAKIVMSGVRDGLAGKETKAARLIREAEDRKANGTQIVITENVSVETAKEERHNSKDYKEARSVEEVQALINAMRNSAITLATCIRILSNTVVKDKGGSPELRLEMQKELESLTTQEMMGQINQLLEDKNRNLLDQSSLMMLAAFRDGNFIVDGEPVPIKYFFKKFE
ncbi:hypothetical protein N4T77_00170 [Clostridium sp. CX1]|uniref:hypothetical protein n=1 Tax=Clostridium sp. CX1 TaxID=2978346 RepID=UPI0021BEC24F|nr:hypothetical protein [Clostridium sp. CX1]MCT8975003.1 hypothetical protein [Clostridium sp. CX1]